MTIEGRVTHLAFEGGFWGIVGDDGQHYEPTEPLPEACRQEGQRVKAEVEEVGAVSFRQWGQPVRVRSITRT